MSTVPQHTKNNITQDLHRFKNHSSNFEQDEINILELVIPSVLLIP